MILLLLLLSRLIYFEELFRRIFVMEGKIKWTGLVFQMDLNSSEAWGCSIDLALSKELVLNCTALIRAAGRCSGCTWVDGWGHIQTSWSADLSMFTSRVCHWSNLLILSTYALWFALGRALRPWLGFLPSDMKLEYVCPGSEGTPWTCWPWPALPGASHVPSWVRQTPFWSSLKRTVCSPWFFPAIPGWHDFLSLGFILTLVVVNFCWGFPHCPSPLEQGREQNEKARASRHRQRWDGGCAQSLSAPLGCSCPCPHLGWRAQLCLTSVPPCSSQCQGTQHGTTFLCQACSCVLMSQ